ncbi:DNA helicase [Vibrio phage K567]
MNIKDRIEELIGSVHNCTTKDGVCEIEKLYAQKKKELGANITPMMDIRVRDAIRGKCDMFDAEAAERDEAKQVKETEAAAAAIAGKFDEGLHHTTEKEFFLHETVIDESAIDAMCIMDVDGSIPTNGHKELSKSLAEACEHVNAQGRIFVPEEANKLLSINERVEIIESFSDVDVVPKGVMFAEVEQLIERDITRVFAFVESDKVAEYRRLGKHFLRSGGHRFEIVEIKNKVPSNIVENLIRDDSLEEFFEQMPMPMNEAEKIFDRQLERLLG